MELLLCRKLSEKEQISDLLEAEVVIRFDILYDSLKAKPKNSTEDAFRLLKSVNQEITEWSVVYNLTEFTADYAVDSDYKNTIHLSPKDY